MRALAVVAVLAACGPDRFGAYLEIHSDVGFDHVELFFGGAFQQRRSCGSASLANPPPIVATATWSPRTSTTSAMQDPSRVTMWRRQYHADTDSKDFPAGTTSYTVRLPTLEDDADFTDTLGSELFVYTTGTKNGQTVHEYAQVQGVQAPPDLVNEYDIPLTAIEQDHEIEVWGAPGDFSCIRNTFVVPGDQATTFIVREWDHDCDGLPTQLCPATSAHVVDCDPESYCVPDAQHDCAVVGACMAPAMVADATGEMVCNFGTCSNAGGQRSCNAATGTVGTCVSEAMCQVELTQCDRRLDQCAPIDAAPDVRRAIPAMAMGNDHSPRDTTAPLTVALQGIDLAAGCPTLAVLGEVPRGNALPELTFAVETGTTSCNLVLTPGAVHGFHDLGFLPTTRLLLQFGTSESTMLVDVAGSLDCGNPATCTVQPGNGSGSGSGDPFSGSVHSCL